MFVITGGSRGIGAALAKSLAEANHTVLIVGRNPETLEAVTQCSPLIQSFCADVSTTAGRAQLVEHLTPHEHIKALVHNAGAIDPIAPIQTLSNDAWCNIMETNLNAPLFLTQALIPKLVGQRVLHIGSGAAYFPVQGWAPYCVSKAGLAMLTRCWQLECPDIATASVMPGIIATEMQAHIRHAEHMAPEKRKFFQDLHDNNQLITPETVACFLTWLLLTIDEKRYVSQEWDIYETKHHVEWLKPPHSVPALE